MLTLSQNILNYQPKVDLTINYLSNSFYLQNAGNYCIAFKENSLINMN